MARATNGPGALPSPQPWRSTMSGNGPSIVAGGSVKLASSGTPSQVGTRTVVLPAQNWTPLASAAHGTRPPNTLVTTDAVTVEASSATRTVTAARRTVSSAGPWPPRGCATWSDA